MAGDPGLKDAARDIVDETREYFREVVEKQRSDFAPRTTPDVETMDARVEVTELYQLYRRVVKGRGMSAGYLDYEGTLYYFLMHYLDSVLPGEKFDLDRHHREGSDVRALVDAPKGTAYDWNTMVSKPLTDRKERIGYGGKAGSKIWMTIFPTDLQRRITDRLASLSSLEEMEDAVLNFPVRFSNDYVSLDDRPDHFYRIFAHEVSHFYVRQNLKGKRLGIVHEAFGQFTHRYLQQREKEGEEGALDFRIGRFGLGGYEDSLDIDVEDLVWMVLIIRERAKITRQRFREEGKEFNVIDWARENELKISDQEPDDMYEFLEYFLPYSYYREISALEKFYSEGLYDALKDLEELYHDLGGGQKRHVDEEFREDLETDLRVNYESSRKVLREAVDNLWGLERIKHEIDREAKDMQKDAKELEALLRDVEKLRKGFEEEEISIPSVSDKSTLEQRLVKVQEQLMEQEEKAREIEEEYGVELLPR